MRATMSNQQARARLASMQAELVRSLTGLAGAPQDFDPARLQAAANALQTKRMRAVARAWPSLARSLGKRYPQQFAAFASQTPLPQGGSSLDDGWAFARWLDQAGELAEPGRL